MNKTFLLNNVRIVLSHTSHPGNIGSAARAMKTMGLADLRLVNPKRFPDPAAHAMSSGALDVLDNARVCASLEEALSGCVFTVGCTARRRDLSHPMLSARDAAPVLLKHAARQPVALVFGTEMSGLTNAELDRCQLLAHIPSNPDYSSLNLASAVQVLAYELRCALPGLPLPPADTPELAQHEDVELFYHQLERTLISTGFLNPAAPRRLMTRLRRLYARTLLEKEELNFLMGILKAMRKVD
ncbi:tRNA (cytidine/uridine-2'-O-)-methyltransferase TrmJ [Sulfuriferula plumbiphila]|uniref:tRNA (cytidine/uridine-2'-O-)-methyltransferase TrmJ n=1 Tax=Sulfuriferula plumbiphila TaxID=171865 RepID=A0A512L665_9PROT|nr:RNA methyltransferase [Sulfuriferula plumbiphila]BBP03569.1 tRNA (cytidine/uridine-2'-O-)-methyltransferase TrmJ [Sulfuriferula plumbiphila]GEP29970.1 tRNA (cytidine/uridine-2'-O-)-methyltransferase TrmJ [Sulfuriferula plumbiphila]